MTEPINPNSPEHYQPKNHKELSKYQLFDVEKFIRQIKGPSLKHIIGDQSHLEDHLTKTLVEQLDTILMREQNRTFMSSINNKSLMRKVIREALSLHAEAIAVWAGVTATAGISRLSLDVSLPPEMWKDITSSTKSVGVGYDNNKNILAYETYDYCVVLARREIDQHTPFGFGVYTVYPNIRSENAEPAGFEIQTYIRDTINYKEGGAVRRAYLEHISKFDQNIPLIRYGENKAHDYITLALPSESSDHIICLLDEKRTTITIYDNKYNDKTKTILSDYEGFVYLNKFPEYNNAVKKLRKNINTFIREQQ